MCETHNELCVSVRMYLPAKDKQHLADAFPNIIYYLDRSFLDRCMSMYAFAVV